jgi:hypothetical protein
MFSELRSTLSMAGSLLYERIMTNIDSKNIPKDIKSATFLGSVVDTSDSMSISITTDGEVAPTALAYEFGSGEHAELGTPAKYPIPVDGTTPMYIDTSTLRGGYNGPPPTPAVIVVHKVMHPGVEKRPYTQPAINETADQIFEMIGDSAFQIIQKAVIDGNEHILA